MKRFTSALALGISLILGATTITACEDTIPAPGQGSVQTMAPGEAPANPITQLKPASDSKAAKPANPAQQQHTGTVTAPVVRVVDGDTIVVNFNGTNETVRLIGIDTPETKKPNTPVQPFGPEATEHMRALVAEAGNTVRLTFDPSQGERDRYQRLLAYAASPAGNDFGEAQLRAGLAKEYTYRTAYAKQATYKAAETQAKNAHIGIWS